MKHIQFFFFFIVLFIVSVNTYAQSLDRVLSAEEFRQRIIEEKRQQLRREIQVSENDRMTILYDESIFMSIPYVKGLQFVNIKFKMMGDIVFALREKKQNELMIIFANTNDELNQMLLIQGKKTVNLLYYNYPSNSFSVKERYQISNTFFEKLVYAFNAFLAISPENREKVAQAIRDYRLAEFIKDVLPDVESERNITTGNFRFIGFTAGFGFATAASDKYNYYDPEAGPAMIFDVNFRYAYLFRRNNNLHVGFIIDVGIWSEFANQQLYHPGFNFLFGVKYKRFLFGIGCYFYLISPFQKQKYVEFKATSFKKIDIGLILSMNFLLGSRMNYLLGIDIRINLNKRIITRNTATGEILDETGHTAIFIKFGYGF